MSTIDGRMGWLANTVPMHLPLRKFSLVRIGCHLLFWLYDGQSFYNTLVRILTVPSTATLPPGPNPYALTVGLLDHIVTTIFIFYLVGYTVIPILMNQLVYQRTTGRIEWRKMVLIVGVIFFMFIFYGLNNYYLFSFLHQLPHPSPYVERWYGTIHTGGLLGLFRDYDITQFIFAYNFSYVLIPLLLKTIREAVGWGVHSYRQGLRNEQLTFTKLQTLQYQINPHFLFNNFNSIYGLI
ncbi:MAG: histidine kinase, partial [Rudanella sp.]|nr:histidine kinase [Rudanella sp.]